MTQVPPSMPPSGPPPVVPVCYRHPKRETYVRCTRCERSICPECMNAASVGHQCPECVAEGRRSQRSSRTTFGGTSAGAQGFVTKTLVGINVFMMLVAVVSRGNAGALFGGGGGGLGGLLGGITPLHFWGSLVAVPTDYANCDGCPVIASVEGVAGGEYYRIITSVFLHYGVLHLLMNMWALWILGRWLEEQFGPVRFLALYLLSGLGGSVAVYLFAQPSGLTAGASGAIFGLFAALFITLKRLRRDTSALIPVLLLNVAFSLLPGISFLGHLGGAVTGAVVGAAFAFAPRAVRTQVQVAASVCALLVFAALVVVRTTMLTAGF